MSKPSASRRQTYALCFVSVIALITVALLVLSPAHREAARTASSPSLASRSLASQSKTITPAARERLRASFAALPLAFEQNQGQTDPQVKYMARANGYTLFLTNNDAVFSLRSKPIAKEPTKGRGLPELRAKNSPNHEEGSVALVRMQLVGGNSGAPIAAGEQLPGKTNYYLGNDPRKWRTNVSQYARVSYKNVYPGVNLAYHGEHSQLEFDFIVAPESNPAAIDLAFSGAQQVTTDESGNLVVASAAGHVVLHKPVAYQQQNGSRQLVDARFVLKANNQVSFGLGSYDRNRELVIDPTLTYATYLGGAEEDEVYGIAVDSANNIYVTGESDSTSGWPTSAGGNVPANHSFDVFVTKLTSTGVMSYTTFVGGANTDVGLAIAVDSSNAAYVTGTTQSTDFPTTAGTPQPVSGGGGSCTNTKRLNSPCTDAFAFKLSASGASVWATYIGGSNDDDGYAIAVDHLGNAWVAGDTFSANFPVADATTTLFTTFNNGGTLNPPADDGFVVEINSTGTAPFSFATYLGGKFGDQINGIAIDSTNNVYVAGETSSDNFPTTSGAYQTKCGSDGACNANSSTSYYDAFVTKLAPGGASLVYSTYVGGSSDDYAFAVALDSSGDAYITGSTSNDDTTTTPAVPYPTTPGAFSTTYNASASSNAFVTELNPKGSALVYSTFLGGSVEDFGGGIAVDSFNDAYVTGMTQSANFPITSNAFQSQLNGNGSTTASDAFVTQVLEGGSKLGFSSFLGGTGDENANASGSVGTIALDSSNNIWVGGSTNSTNFPVTSTAAQPTYGGNPYDGFVAGTSSATAPDFNIAATTPAAVAPGGNSTSTVTLTSLFGYSSSVNLSCSVSGGTSPLVGCSVTGTNPQTPSAGGATSTVTMTTTGTSGALFRPRKIFYAMWLPIAGLSLMGIGFSSARSRRKKVLGLLMVGMVMAALFLMPACGGSSSTTTSGCPGCTTPGNYTVTITGTDANNLSHSTQVTLTVSAT
ncbi:MAG: SBBP repeat-containing protein [Candidatus Sulfotelmatobacter sp.]